MKYHINVIESSVIIKNGEVIRRFDMELVLDNLNGRFNNFIDRLGKGVSPWLLTYNESHDIIVLNFYIFFFHQKRTWVDNPLTAFYNLGKLRFSNFDMKFEETDIEILKYSKFSYLIREKMNFVSDKKELMEFISDFIKGLPRCGYNEAYTKVIIDLLEYVRDNAL